MVEDLKVLFSFGVSPSFNFLFMPDLFALSLLLLHFQFSVELILFLFLQSIGPFPGEPSSGQSLNEKGCLIPPFFPHFSIEVHDWLDYFIVPGVNEEALFLHLSADLSLAFGGLADPFVGLSFSSEAQFMIGSFLIGLGISIPAFDVGVHFTIASYEWLFLIDPYDLNHLCPLLCHIAFLIPFDDHRLDLIVIVRIVLHLWSKDVEVPSVLGFIQACEVVTHTQ